MSRHICQQPNGRYAVFSTTVDDFVILDATVDELLEDIGEDAKRKARAQAEHTMKTIGEAGLRQRFTSYVQEAIDVHGRDAGGVAMLRRGGVIK